MKNLMKIQLIVVISLLWLIQAAAQSGRGMNRQAITRLYNDSTVVTVTGEITQIDTKKQGYGRFDATLLTLKTEHENVNIYIAPNWFLEQQKTTFKVGDKIVVTGSRVTYEGKPLIICRDFKYNEQSLTLRNENGIPVWAGKGMRPNRPGMGRRAR